MTKVTFEDAFNLLCGDKLGSGIHRDVYTCRIRDDLVVKVEIEENWRNFANVKEHMFWSDWQHYDPIGSWLAPCDYLSPDGRISLQKRCEPLSAAYQMPEMVPSFLTDHKRENFGLYEGRLVCVDYAATVATPFKRLKRA